MRRKSHDCCWLGAQGRVIERCALTSIDEVGDSQAERVERMKREFLDAQQRRRRRAPQAATRPDHTDDGPGLAGPADDTPTGIAVAVRP